MAGDHLCLHVTLLALLLSTALAAVSVSSPGWQGSCSFRRTPRDHASSVSPDTTPHKPRNRGRNIRLCLDLLGARCQALSHTQESQGSSANSSSETMIHRVNDPGYLVFTSCRAQTSQGSTEPESTGPLASGVYPFDLQDGGPPFSAFFDMTTDGGGWIVFQRRQDGSVDFNLNWTDYQQGFGDLEGNELLHRLSAAGLRELRVDLGDWDGNTSFAHYAHFSVGDAASNYTVTISGYNGTAGDGLSSADGMWFSTRDSDNDQDPTQDCAASRRGAWWFRQCGMANLNSLYGGPGDRFSYNVLWEPWRGISALPFTEMKLR